MDEMSRKVLLLRNSKGSKDPYEKELTQSGFQPSSIPVLSFQFTNLDTLHEVLEKPQHFSGFIFTSQRAAEAVQKCIAAKISQKEWEDQLKPQWNSLLIFSIAGATQKAVESIGLNCHGGDAHSAEDLVPVICQSVSSGDKPLVFLCGNLSKETIPQSLMKAGISLQNIIVYSTMPHNSIRESLQDHIHTEGVPGTVVFFSPSGVDFAMESLCSMVPDISIVKLVAIGKTTAKALTDKEFVVSGVSAEPNPASLAQCLTAVYSTQATE